MNRQHIARASATIEAPLSAVWEAFTNAEIIKRYMFGTTVKSEWREGSPITWTGEWQGKTYEDKGEILRIEPERLIEYSHFSPMSGLPDKPESYHTVTVELSPESESSTSVSLSQDNNPTDDAKEHSETNWAMMLSSLKAVLEK